jgi:excinuclease ABC subunit C
VTPEAFKAHQPNIPAQPGVYQYFDEDDKLLYVGKAKDLRKRVSSYFRNKYDNYRIKLLVRRIARIEITVVESEKDALLLENSLVKQHQPRYNIQLKDDKSFPFICIKNEPFPRIFMTRRVVQDGSEYLGPYTSAKKTRGILQFLFTLFPIRNCTLSLTPRNISSGKFKVCLEYHIGNCLGPCEGRQQESDYLENIAQVRHILRGNFAPVKRRLREHMETCASKLEFERAEQYRKRLESLEDYQARSTIVSPALDNVDAFALTSLGESAFIGFIRVMQGTVVQTRVSEVRRKLDESDEELLGYALPLMLQEAGGPAGELLLPFALQEETYGLSGMEMTVPQRGDKRKLVELALRNALQAKAERSSRDEEREKKEKRQSVLEILQKDFRLPQLPEHLECFDNSNLQGSNPVASMVVFRNGKPSKKDYRHFSIKTVQGPDDFASMREVVGRRYKRLLEEGQALPQLVVIDGGKGQLSAAVEALEALGLRDQVTIVGIAKKLEEIYYPGDSLPMLLDKRSPGLKVIQQLRNEAHRFAISFHRDKRSANALKTTELEGVPGIGPKTREALLKHFRSVAKLKEASFEEVAALIGEARANRILEHFRSGE